MKLKPVATDDTLKHQSYSNNLDDILRVHKHNSNHQELGYCENKFEKIYDPCKLRKNIFLKGDACPDSKIMFYEKKKKK